MSLGVKTLLPYLDCLKGWYPPAKVLKSLCDMIGAAVVQIQVYKYIKSGSCSSRPRSRGVGGAVVPYKNSYVYRAWGYKLKKERYPCHKSFLFLAEK